VVRRAALDRTGTRRVERQAGVEPVRGVHAASEVGHDPIRERLDLRVVDPVPVGVVRVAVEARGPDDRDARRLGDGTHARGPAPEADRGHLDDRADPARASVADLLDSAVRVVERLAGERGRVDEQVVVGIDDAEPLDGHRARDADDLASGHVTSNPAVRHPGRTAARALPAPHGTGGPDGGQGGCRIVPSDPLRRRRRG
jgi:hypothetical protein